MSSTVTTADGSFEARNSTFATTSTSISAAKPRPKSNQRAFEDDDTAEIADNLYLVINCISWSFFATLLGWNFESLINV